MRHHVRIWTAPVPLIVLAASLAAAETVSPALEVAPEGIGGALVIAGGGPLPDSVRDEFVRLAGGSKARLVVIPTASGDDTVRDDAAAVTHLWRARGIKNISVLHTRSRDQANDAKFVAPVQKATAVWITGGKQTWLAAAYSGTKVERELHALVARGGVIGGTSAGAACQSRVMIVRGRVFEIPGLGLLPGAVVDQHFLARNRKDRLRGVLALHPGLVGFGVDEGTALVVEGRRIRCVGNSTVTVCFGATARCDCEDLVLKPDAVSDLVMLARRAQARLAPPFPLEKPAPPVVREGALVITGGGTVDAGILRRFIELAGGPRAPIVVLPTGLEEPPSPPAGAGAFLERAGARNVRVVIARERHDVESAGFLNALNEARGVWFGGGRQWRFVDAYEGTSAMAAFRDVLARGGVIGGSSAGATIQGEYLVRGSPLDNLEMMVAGYDRGFAFLPGTAIDQHFSERNRFADMQALVERYPQLLGIGIDEGTALVLNRGPAEILGSGKVHLFDRRTPRSPGAPPYLSYAAGIRIDLVTGAAQGMSD